MGRITGKRQFMVLIAFLAVISLSLSGCSSGKKSLTLSSGGKGGVYYRYSNELEEILSENDGSLSLDVQTSAGSASNLRLLSSGLADLGIVQNDILKDAVEGTGVFESDGPRSDIRAIAGLYTESLQIVAADSADIESIADLKGKKVSVGEKESGVFTNAEAILSSYGLAMADIEPSYLSFDDSAKAMQNGEIDAFFCTASAPTTAVTELSEEMDIHLISLDNRAISQFHNEYSGYSTSVIPAGTYKGQDEDVTTVGVKAVLVTTDDLKDSDAATIISCLFDNADRLENLTGQTDALSPQFASEGIAAPFAKGVQSFYEGEGITVLTGDEPQKSENGALVLKLDMYQTLALAVLALFVGAYLRKKFHFLEAFCIPAPVIGGLIFAIISCILYSAGIMELEFDETLRTVCMVLFFTSVGFQANMKVLKSGGKSLLVFLAGVFVLIVCQNGVATGLSKVLHLDPLIGLCTGSIPMVGGHGTAGAFGPLLEDMNVAGATTVATAAATFGLIAGSLMGGPLANNLIIKRDLLKTAVPEDDTILVEEETKHRRSVSMYAPATYQLAIAAGIGTVVSYLLSKTGMTFPVYIGAMIVAAIMRNISEYTGKMEIYIGEINDLGGICLSLFLGIAMITLKLWQLADLALPLIILLLGQTAFMYIYARFVIFNMMGHDYDAAVLAAGTCGFGMGATPNAMANMQAVTGKFVPSIKAYLLVPIVGSMFADFMNSLTITFFINLLH